MGFEFIVFDLDNTLYPRGSGVMEDIGRRIQAWMCDRLDLDWEEARVLRQRYLHRYGTTMAGLMAEHDVDVSQYLSFVHDIAIEEHLKSNAALSEMLSEIQLRKVIYTNATSEHGQRVVQALGVADQFERIIGIREVGLRNKLSHTAYQRMLALLGVEGQAGIMVEDSPRNLPAAKAVGMTTILLESSRGERAVDPPDNCVDFAVDDVLDVGMVVRQLLTEDESG